MARKKKQDDDGGLGFGDIEDDFFASGDSDEFWEGEGEGLPDPAVAAAEAAAEIARAEEAARIEAERLAAEEQAAAEQAAAEQAAAEQAAAEQAAAEQAAAEKAAAETAAAETAAAETAAAETAAAEQAAAEQAAANEKRMKAAERRQARMEKAEEVARLQGMGPSPTIVALDDEDEAPPLETLADAVSQTADAEAAPKAEWEVDADADIEIEDGPIGILGAVTLTMEDDEGEETVEQDEDEGVDESADAAAEDEPATAEQLVDAVVDTMVPRRPMPEAGPEAGQEAGSDAVPASYDADEIRLAKAEREERRRAAEEAGDEEGTPAPVSPLDMAAAEIPTGPPPPVVPVGERASTRPGEAYVPGEDEHARWLEAAVTLEREARAEQDGARAAMLYAEAGRLHFARLNNWDEADRLFTLAVAGGVDDPDVLKSFADVVANRGDFEQLRELLEKRAAKTGGATAAEALQDAALVERNSLRNDANAVALLDRALVQVPEDWFALRLLRELHYRSQSWSALTDVLEKMAALASGPRRARILVELGRLCAEHIGDRAAARAAYARAREADPSNAGAFLALERLARAAGDAHELATLYRGEAARLADGDAAFWLTRAARVAAATGEDADGVVATFRDAIAASPETSREARRALAAFLTSNERWPELAEALAAEAETAGDTEKGFILYRLAQVQERHLDQPDAAIASYRAAAEADPSSGPATEAVARLLGTTGRHDELIEFLADRLPTLDDPNLVVTALYRMGEICEGPLADQPKAREYFEKILDTAPGYLPALEGLERVYTRLENWDRLAAVYEQRAILADEPGSIALQLHRAGAVADIRLNDRDKARDFYRRALENVPDFPPSMDAYLRILEGDDDWAGLARVLRNAAEVTKDGNEQVSFTYRSARLLADKVGDFDQAIELLQRCLELSPGFLPAITLYRDLSARTGVWQSVYELNRLEADSSEDLERRHWRILVASEAAEHLDDVDAGAIAEEILLEDPGHIGALGMIEDHALRTGLPADVLAVYRRMMQNAQDEASRVRLSQRVAELAVDVGDPVAAMSAVSEIVASDVDARPLAAMARIAESLDHWEEAQRALVGSTLPDASAEAARLQETWGDDPAAAAERWRSILETSPGDTEAASGLERALSLLGDREGLAETHALLADNLPDPAIAAVHSLLAGHLFEAAEDLDKAKKYYELAYAARPSAGKAFDALRRVATQAGDADALVELFSRLAEPNPLELAAALEEAGTEERALGVLRDELARATDAGAAESALLPLLVRIEQGAAGAASWKEVFELLTRRLPLLHSGEERSAAEAKRRWILAEHLAGTDEAWDFYRQLHEEEPDDPEVLVALARIAAARGETDLAIQYLEGLASVAPDKPTGALYQRRIAEAQLSAGDTDAAQAAYLRALDMVPDDIESMAGLRDLAEKSENWPALVGVLAREATVTEGDEQVERYRRIARIWDEKIGDSGVAADSWRKVLEVVPGDSEALHRLVALSRTQTDWRSFVEAAEALAPLLTDEQADERTDLLAELGRVYLHELGREEDALRFLDAATVVERPNLEAARMLEQVQAARGAWSAVVEAVLRQARASEGTDKVELLVRAAQMSKETLHDRDRAAEIYGAVIEAEPENGEALRFRAEYLYEKGDLDGAVEIFGLMEHEETERDTDDFDVRIEVASYYFRFADSLRTLGRIDEALNRYQSALDMNPSHLPTLEAVGPLYLETARYDDAAQVFRRVLQLTGGQGDPEKVARTYVNLGMVELHLGNLDKAKKRFTKALDMRPNDVSALQGVAQVLLARGDWNNVLNVYNNIIYHAQEPREVVDAYLTKGFVLDAKMSLPDKAAQHYEKSLAFDPSQPGVLLRLAELALRKQDWPEAASLAERGLKLADVSGGIRGGLHLVKAIALGACGDDAAAKESTLEALHDDPTLSDVVSAEKIDPSSSHAALRSRLQARL